MIFLHTADWHLGAYVGPQCDNPAKRMESTRRCLDKLVETARHERPDIILIAGDIWHQAKIWNDRSNIELRMAADYIEKLKEVAPVAVLYGTPTHDSRESFDSLAWMCGDERCSFFDEPEVARYEIAAGPVQIALLPGLDKGHFRSLNPGLSAEEENAVFSRQLAQIVEGLSAQLDPGIPAVLMAHHTVVGCELDNGTHIFQTTEVVLPASALDNSRFDMVCLGHIHKAQQVESCKKPVYYSGSLDATTFSDEGWPRGFWIHEIREKVWSQFFETPAREFQTERWTQEETQKYVSGEPFSCSYQVKDKVVRVLYTCDAATEKALDKRKLERDLYAAGAYYVTEIRPETITASVNRETLHDRLTANECLNRYLEEKGHKQEAMARISEAAQTFISIAEAGIPAGSQTGIFLPLGLTVTNYRSYAEENLDFAGIRFAMVNGRNGSGKSSLFMDALVDCLYEQPREGELTGWIRAGEKSGSISFTFRLGDDTYRVTRTRQRSGKATLAIAKLEGFGIGMSLRPDFELNWRDISSPKLADTQQAVIDLLGMDAETFRSCVLIMQDQYGRFMEAKPEDRMGVLANLLGLGIYERLEELAKAQLTETNRQLKAAKAEIEQMETQTSLIPELESSIHTSTTVLSAREEHKKHLEALITQLEERRNAYSQARKELQWLNGERVSINKQYEDKSASFAKLLKEIEDTEKFIEAEDRLNGSHARMEELRLEKAQLQSKVDALEQKQRQYDEFNRVNDQYDVKIGNLIKEIAIKKGAVSLRESIQQEMAEIAESAGMAEKLHDLGSLYSSVSSEVKMLESRLHVLGEKFGNCWSQREMMKESGCIDFDRAGCKFLASAKKAAEEMTEINAEMEAVKAQLKTKGAELYALGYDPDVHQRARKDSQTYSQLQIRLERMDGEAALLEEMQGRKQELEKTAREYLEQTRRLYEEMVILQAQTTGAKSIDEEMGSLAEDEEIWAQLPEAKAYLKTAEQQSDDLALDVDHLWEKLQGIDAEIKKTSATLIGEGNSQVDLLNAKTELEACALAINQLHREMGGTEQQLRDLKAKEGAIALKRQAACGLADYAADLQVLAQAFGQEGIPHQIIRDIVPELESSANEILGRMTGGRMRLEFRTERVLKSNKAKEVATLEIVIIDSEYGELPYLSRSGGQKTRCSLAVIFALALLKASRVGMQLGFLFIDEPAGLDEEGIDGYCSALESIHSMHPDMRIVAISHDERMKARFAQQLFVEITDNGSKVRRT